jgi:nicotinamide riboside transporter PnuC
MISIILQVAATALSVIGVQFVVRKDWRGHAMWVVANVLWIGIDLWHGVFLQAALFTYYLVMAIIGAWKWRKDAREGQEEGASSRATRPA